MKKSKFCFVLWIVLIATGTIFSAVMEILKYLNLGIFFETPPYAKYQMFLLLVFLPFVLTPLLCFARYYAIKEKNKKIEVASVCFIIHHAICIIAVLSQIIAA